MEIAVEFLEERVARLDNESSEDMGQVPHAKSLIVRRDWPTASSLIGAFPGNKNNVQFGQVSGQIRRPELRIQYPKSAIEGSQGSCKIKYRQGAI